MLPGSQIRASMTKNSPPKSEITMISAPAKPVSQKTSLVLGLASLKINTKSYKANCYCHRIVYYADKSPFL